MKRKHRIVIVDDEPNIGSSLRLILEGEGYGVIVCGSVAEFQPHRAPGRADLYLLDVRLPDGNGIDVLRSLKQSEDPTPVVMISGHATIRDAVEATRSGAFDFLEKPLARDRVLLVIKNALERSDLQRENQRYREIVGDAPKMIGRGDAFRHVLTQATQVAKSDAGVLLTGESGTGKELLAAYIHRESPFAARAFVKVNCAAIPTELIESELFGHERGAFTGATGMRRGKFELADGGTIFLDEVGETSPAMQLRLLRVLQEGELRRVGGGATRRVDIRVIAATNADLEADVAAGRFRRDLYYRLNVFPIRLPPLRERTGDISALADHFLRQACRRARRAVPAVGADALQLLQTYPWPGNVREMENELERAVALADTGRPLAPVHLSERIAAGAGAVATVRTLNEAVEALKRRMIEDALHECGSKTRAAERLGLTRQSLQQMLRRRQ